MAILEVKSVSKHFTRAGRTLHAVNNVSLRLDAGETLAVVGESGSGKSTLGRLVLGLEKPDSGMVRFEGNSLGAMSRKQLRRLRARMSVVFQEPFESLNPRLSVGAIVGEPLRIHFPQLSRTERNRRIDEALEQVALERAVRDAYPGELSGGQQQRVGIARAIISKPSVIVLDEPTSSLDLSVQAQVVQLLQRLQEEHRLAYLFISHDIYTVDYISHRMMVMYLGSVIESGPTQTIMDRPHHPYTRALLASKLSVDPREKLAPLESRGDPPDDGSLGSGGVFNSRCPARTNPCCELEQLQLQEVGPDHFAAVCPTDPFSPSPQRASRSTEGIDCGS